MRDLVLILGLMIGLGITFRYPYAGILLWAWITIQNPHQEAYSVARSLPLNMATVVITVISLMASKARKTPQNDVSIWLIGVLLVWMTFDTFFATSPDMSWPLWDRTWKVFALGIILSICATDKARIHSLIWVIVISLTYYGIKGGLFTIITGGHNRVLGPPKSIIGDNNQLALALLLMLPLANYLRLHTENRLIRLGLASAMVLTFFSILGSYSRGAYLALAGLIVIAWWRSRNKFLYPIVAAAIVIPALHYMPDSFYARLNSINDTDNDQSFQGRLTAWQVAFDAARDHFPLGLGFSGAQVPATFNKYAPGQISHAAHSIYFQVLGDHGFVGLAIYLLLIAIAFWNCRLIMRASRGKADLLWAYDLAAMIQLSLFVFCFGGAALSMAYYDVFVIYLALLPALRVFIAAPSPNFAPAPLKVNNPEAERVTWQPRSWSRD